MSQQLLAQLVAFPVLGGMPNLGIIDFIEEYLRGFGVSCTRVYDESGMKACLHARIGPAVDGGIILSGHTDVVPVAGQTWTSDPFTLVERDGRLYGRGACDMKGFLAVVLDAVPTFVKTPLARPIYLAFSYDEEIGCVSGRVLADAIRAHYPEHPAYCIVGEPSGWRPVVGHKGIAVYRLRVRGSAGHSSRIRTEVSAVHEAARLITWLDDYMDGLVVSGRIDARFDPPHSSLHAGMIVGGTAHNIIADECAFTVDIRCLPSDDPNAILADLQAFAKTREAVLQARFAGASIEIEVYHAAVPALDTPVESEIVKLIQELTGLTSTETVAYASEAGQFTEAGFATVICGPGNIAQAHRTDEYVEFAQLARGKELMQALAVRLSQAEELPID